MPSVSGNVGAVFNGGTITSPLTIKQAHAASPALVVADEFDDELVSFYRDGGTLVRGDIWDASTGVVVGATQDFYVNDHLGNTIIQVHGDGTLGVFGATAVARPTVTGAKLASDVVMASLLTALAALGLVADSTT